MPSVCAIASESAEIEEGNFETLKVYPNPSQGSFSINHLTNNDLPYTISILNELGQIVLEKTIFENKTIFEVPYPGVFTLQNVSNGKNTQQKLFAFNLRCYYH